MDNSINHKNSNNHSMDNKYLNSNLDNETESKINYVQNNFVYGWGRNKNGELGLGKNSFEYYSSPQAVKSLKNINVIQIASGGKHTAILTTNGKLYVCGTHILGLLGIDNKEYKDFSIFQKLTTLDHEVIVEVHCAEFHTLCLTNTGQVYAWGGSLHKKLGMNSTGGLPTRVNGLSNRRITQISCGDYHSCALTDSGEIFSWGGGGVSYNKGQCGHGDLKDYDTPKKIDYFKNKRIVKVVCGGYHTLSLTEENKLYGFGKGNFGQCGYGEFEDAPSPKLILFNKKFETFENPFYDKRITSQSQQSNFVIKDIKCGGYHSVILSAMGKVYTFGHNMNGQLGLGDTKNHSSPELVKSIMKKNIVMIGAGWSHTFVLTDHGNLYSCGSAKYGELGLDDKEDKKNFILIKKVDHLNISNIGAGGHHTWIILGKTNFILDTINPIKRDYHSPSPIVSGTGSPKKSNTPSPKHINQTDMTNKSRLQESSFQQQSKPARKEKIKLNMDLLSEKNPCDKVFLQVAFTDLKMSHRFLRFTLCSKFKDITLRDFTKKISDYLKKDQCVEFFRLQDDSDVLNFTDHGLTSLYKDIKNSFKLLEMSKKLNYSLCIVYDLNKIPQILNIKCDLENRKKRAETKSIYDVLILSRDDIISNDIERVLSYWTIDFQEFFSEVIEENIKFLELRPNSFYI